jgi:hypothetical protein
VIEFKCAARAQIREEISLTLAGLTVAGAREDFSFEVTPPPRRTQL